MRRSRKSVFSEEKITVFFIGFYSLEAVGGTRKPCSKMGEESEFDYCLCVVFM